MECGISTTLFMKSNMGTVLAGTIQSPRPTLQILLVSNPLQTLSIYLSKTRKAQTANEIHIYLIYRMGVLAQQQQREQIKYIPLKANKKKSKSSARVRAELTKHRKKEDWGA